MTEHWSSNEVELIVADYFSMLVDELAGKNINKTQQRNALRPLLNNRSGGSIEFKHQNISAVLIHLGLPFIRGYKPKSNYQNMLEDVVISQLIRKKIYLESKFATFADLSVPVRDKLNFSSIVESPPEQESIIIKSKAENPRRPIKINYLEREQKNSDLGTKGELLAIEYEKWRLRSEGKFSLADKVEWIAKYDDGAGFDILSKNNNGTDRYIEVKTTKLNKFTPIFFTRNEFDFSVKNRKSFHLYRVFNFNNDPKLFRFEGCFDDFCKKEAVLYSGRF